MSTAGNGARRVVAMNAESWVLFGKALVLCAAAIATYAVVMRLYG